MFKELKLPLSLSLSIKAPSLISPPPPPPTFMRPEIRVFHGSSLHSLCSLAVRRGSISVTSWKKNKITKALPKITRMPGFTATKTIPQLVNNPLILRLVLLKVQKNQRDIINYKNVVALLRCVFVSTGCRDNVIFEYETDCLA